MPRLVFKALQGAGQSGLKSTAADLTTDLCVPPSAENTP